MTSGISQRAAVASRVERLVERAMTFAVDQYDDDVAVARLAWLAQDDHPALEEAGELCLKYTEVNLVVRARAAGLLARVRHHDLRRPPSMRNRAMVGYGERSAIQAGTGGRAGLEGATAKMSTEVGDLDAALAALYQLPLEQFVATRDQLARRLRAAGDRDTARRVVARRRPPVSAWAANQLASAAPNAVAETLLIRAGHAASDATLARLAATLQAAATGDEATRAALAQGRLPGDLDPAGFGLDLVPVLADQATV